jgi:hypothetical protein
MTYETDVTDLLRTWQIQRFKETDVTLNEVAESLSTEEPLVEGRVPSGGSSSRWIVSGICPTVHL